MQPEERWNGAGDEGTPRQYQRRWVEIELRLLDVAMPAMQWQGLELVEMHIMWIVLAEHRKLAEPNFRNDDATRRSAVDETRKCDARHQIRGPSTTRLPMTAAKAAPVGAKLDSATARPRRAKKAAAAARKLLDIAQMSPSRDGDGERGSQASQEESGPFEGADSKHGDPPGKAEGEDRRGRQRTSQDSRQMPQGDVEIQHDLAELRSMRPRLVNLGNPGDGGGSQPESRTAVRDEQEGEVGPASRKKTPWRRR